MRTRREEDEEKWYFRREGSGIVKTSYEKNGRMRSDQSSIQRLNIFLNGERFKASRIYLRDTDDESDSNDDRPKRDCTFLMNFVSAIPRYPSSKSRSHLPVV